MDTTRTRAGGGRGTRSCRGGRRRTAPRGSRRTARGGSREERVEKVDWADAVGARRRSRRANGTNGNSGLGSAAPSAQNGLGAARIRAPRPLARVPSLPRSASAGWWGLRHVREWLRSYTCPSEARYRVTATIVAHTGPSPPATRRRLRPRGKTGARAQRRVALQLALQLLCATGCSYPSAAEHSRDNSCSTSAALSCGHSRSSTPSCCRLTGSRPTSAAQQSLE